MQPRQTLPRRARHIIAVGFALLLITDATAFAATGTRAPGASTEAAMRAAVGSARSHPVLPGSVVAAAIAGQEAAMRASVGKAKIDAINPAIQGEAKNVWPFTRRVRGRSPQGVARASAPASTPRGEPKNQPPFVRAAPPVGSSGEAFNWTDAAIGLLAGIAISISAAAALLIARKSPLTA
jgi:hypothetical protein